VIQLLVEGYLVVQLRSTAYTTYTYLIPSPAASRLTRHAREDLERCEFSVRCHFPIKARKSAKGKRRAVSVEEDPPPQDAATTSRAKPSCPTKRKREEVDDPEDDENVIEISSDVGYEDDEILEAGSPPQFRGGWKPSDSGTRKAEARPNVTNVDSDSEENDIADFEGDDVWMYSHRPHPQQRRRTKSPATMADLSDF